MGLEARLNICLFPVVMLSVIYWNARKTAPRQFENRLFLKIVLMTIVLIAGELITWIPEGLDIDGMDWIYWTVNLAYIFLSACFSLLWFLYACCKLFGEKAVKHKRNLVLICMPMAINSVLLLTSPWTKLVMDVRDGYARGPLFYVPYIIISGYIIVSAILALRKGRKENDPEKKREFRYLSLFMVLPVIGFALQIWRYDLLNAWPFIAVSILLVYINTQNKQITTDALTGLNNRGQLEKYLLARLESTKKRNDRWVLMLLDIDSFKYINDKYGHTAGDRALCMVADCMKSVFGKSKAFLARYGGDEFAVVMERKPGCNADDIVSELNRELLKTGKRTDESYRLMVSAGLAEFGMSEAATAESLLKEADEQMYLAKMRKQKETGGKSRD